MVGEPKMECNKNIVPATNFEEAEPTIQEDGEQEEYNIKSERDFITEQISKGVTEMVCLLPLHKENTVVDGYRVIQTGGWDGREVRVEKIEA